MGITGTMTNKITIASKRQASCHEDYTCELHEMHDGTFILIQALAAG